MAGYGGKRPASKAHAAGNALSAGIPAGGMPGSMDPIAGIGLGNSGGAVYGGKAVSNPKLPSPATPADRGGHPIIRYR